MVRERQAPAEGTHTPPGGGGGETGAPAAGGSVDARDSSGGAAFDCRTCGRRFSSFQALGGHRTGHARLRARHGAPAHKAATARAHGCAVCGLEFPMGQALGGHMRRHRGDARSGEEEEVLDLNSPSMEDGDREGRSSSASEPRLLNLLV